MRLVSVLGDSISTFEGYNPEDYAVYYDKYMQDWNGLRNVEDTWWARVIRSLHARLCVNNSYSGSRVTGETFPAGASEERLRNLGTEENGPDLILIYMGLNDFAGGIDLVSSLDSFGFEDSYDIMLKTIKRNYPSAKIVCGTLMPAVVKDRSGLEVSENAAGIGLEEYNETIRLMAQENDCYLADLARGTEKCETLDGFHPTARGHETIAGKWISCLNNLELF